MRIRGRGVTIREDLAENEAAAGRRSKNGGGIIDSRNKGCW